MIKENIVWNNALLSYIFATTKSVSLAKPCPVYCSNLNLVGKKPHGKQVVSGDLDPVPAAVLNGKRKELDS
jgi:hypothetical protein